MACSVTLLVHALHLLTIRWRGYFKTPITYTDNWRILIPKSHVTPPRCIISLLVDYYWKV